MSQQKNGTGFAARKKRYEQAVAIAAGLINHPRNDGGANTESGLLYAPDYLDALARRMGTPEQDVAERTYTWLVYRASGNQSLSAIHVYRRQGEGQDVETELRQSDCCLELAWLEAGHRIEWLDAPRYLFEQECARRGVEPIDRRDVSEGFIENRERGLVANGSGHRLELVPSPQFVPDSWDKSGEAMAKIPTNGGNEKAKTYQAFCKEWNVLHSQEYQEEEVLRSRLKELRTVRLSAYKEWRKSETPAPNGAPSLESLESIETVVSQSVSHSEEKDRPTDTNSRMPESEPPCPPLIPDDAEKMQNLLMEELGETFPAEIPGRTLCLQLVQAMGDAPFERLRIKIRSHKWKRGDTMGLALALAGDVRRRWILDSAQRRKEEQTTKTTQEAAAANGHSDEPTNEELRAEAEKKWDELPAAEKAARIKQIAPKVIYGHLQSAAQKAATEESAAMSQFVDEILAQRSRGS